MSRAYNYLKAFVSSEWDRLTHLEEDLARKELNEASGKGRGTATHEEKVSDSPPQTIVVPVDPGAQKTYARGLLGVAETATFEQIREAFKRLNQRSDPSKFPAGSAEESQAAQIQRKVHWAYGVLSDGIDDTEKRFRSLEI